MELSATSPIIETQTDRIATDDGLRAWEERESATKNRNMYKANKQGRARDAWEKELERKGELNG